MQKVTLTLGAESLEFSLPDGADILSMKEAAPLPHPAEAIEDALRNPIGSPSLDEIIAAKLQQNPNSTAAIVISDNTRPVPYKGESGILWPIIDRLLSHGIPSNRILVLVANGTHRQLSRAELEAMLDPRVFRSEVQIINHDCRAEDDLVFLGTTRRGTETYVNKHYVQADIKILTGLVESHFMAGASGGRKSICPGLVGEKGTYIFHSAPILASPNARDLVLSGNPCHEEALEIAQMAGADFIVNVTLDHSFRVTGVYAGDLVKAHEKAVEKIKKDVAIPIDTEYDIVITHAGFVGINHYQAAKVGTCAIPVVKSTGKLVVIANTTDTDPVGSHLYKTVLHLLKLIGPERFNRLIQSPDWTFIPEQWQVQMWAKLFSKLPMENFIYYSPQFEAKDYEIIPGTDGNMFLPDDLKYRHSFQAGAHVIENVIKETVAELKRNGQQEVRIAYMSDGPYGIPIRNC